MPLQSSPQEHHIHLGDLLGVIFQTASEKVQAVAATGAILTPLWLPNLQDVSREAALFAPILGCVWLSLQIALRLFEFFFRKPHKGAK